MYSIIINAIISNNNINYAFTTIEYAFAAIN